jgi:hypothetical protein
VLVLVLDLGRLDGALAGLPKHSISLGSVKPCKASSTARETDLEDDEEYDYFRVPEKPRATPNPEVS